MISEALSTTALTTVVAASILFVLGTIVVAIRNYSQVVIEKFTDWIKGLWDDFRRARNERDTREFFSVKGFREELQQVAAEMDRLSRYWVDTNRLEVAYNNMIVGASRPEREATLDSLLRLQGAWEALKAGADKVMDLQSLGGSGSKFPAGQQPRATNFSSQPSQPQSPPQATTYTTYAYTPSAPVAPPSVDPYWNDTQPDDLDRNNDIYLANARSSAAKYPGNPSRQDTFDYELRTIQGVTRAGQPISADELIKWAAYIQPDKKNGRWVAEYALDGEGKPKTTIRMIVTNQNKKP